ncbi:MAG: tRNA uridine-5-carboxymethylaminomethyl(34) synthesis enzyme MnmG [Clostridia bacterium]|nr:tRNA uridine-5-carboxymethylaminomethyl(34) synthesis enzyme MnmG [Clostridia bacterium]
MKIKKMGQFDIVVVGAGHAGCEAALAAARMGKRTLILSINLEAVAFLFCNPSIGGTGKGHLAREIDALGGQMALVTDQTFIQSKMLNTSKGPAVHSLRAQADKVAYHQEMKRVLESEPNVFLKQGEVISVDFDSEDKVVGVTLKTGVYYETKAVILATGTFLRGVIFIGDVAYPSGPNGLSPSDKLSETLKDQGLKLRRFKTGTPARALSSSLDYSKMIPQYGDQTIVPFSFMNENLQKEQVPCYLSYTNEQTHKVIRENSHLSALYGGLIEGVGPRYCPSIEDKIKRFSDKPRHQLFVEPESLSTDEMYLQGLSSSLPEDVQEAFYKTIPGLENLEIVRPAYAIEYDCIDPLDIQINLEHRRFGGLFCAGQINGSSGYEEAAAQGLMAGINAVLALDGKDPFVIDRSEGYIGVLIDDLVTKGTNEPYRIMTSRAEYRLVLRQDNADIRLTQKGYDIGLVKEERYQKFIETKKAVEEELIRLSSIEVLPSGINDFLLKHESAPLCNKCSLSDLLKRPEMTYDILSEIDPKRPLLSAHAKTKVEVEIKYAGYITKQLAQIEKFKKLETRMLDPELDYMAMEGLRIEAKQKLAQFKPLSLGQASRISGVSPADINVLLIYLEKSRRERNGKA